MELARLNQNQIAAALGVSRATVNAWLNDRAYPQNSLAALEELLGVNLSGEPDEPEPGNGGSKSDVDALRDEVRSMRTEMERLAAAMERRNREDETQAKRRAAG